MTDSTPALTPTEELLLGLLVAHRRLGTTLVLIETRHRAALRSLADKGLIHHEHGSSVERCDKVWLTEAGIVLGLDPGYVPPILSPDCPSFYIGPKTAEFRVDCDRPNRHKGKHRFAYGRGCTLDPVRWTDAEACGLVSKTYGEDVRRFDAEHTARLAEAIARFGKDTSPEDYR